MIDDRYLVYSALVLILVAVAFSWLVAVGPLYQAVAYSGDLQASRTVGYSAADCINFVFYVNGLVVPMSDGVIDRECGGQ